MYNSELIRLLIKMAVTISLSGISLFIKGSLLMLLISRRGPLISEISLIRQRMLYIDYKSRVYFSLIQISRIKNYFFIMWKKLVLEKKIIEITKIDIGLF